MKRIYASIAVLVAVAAGLLSSCSSRSEHHLLDAIPSDASAVAFVDLDRASHDGVDISGLRGFAGIATTGTVAAVTLADGTTLTLTDAPAPDSLAARGYKPSGEPQGEFTAYTDPDGMTAVVNAKSGVAYFMPFSAPRALERATTIAEAAAKLSFASNKGLADIFEQKSRESVAYGAVSRNLMALNSRSSVPANPQDAEWIAFSVKQESGVADIAAQLVEGSGNPVVIQGLRTIDTDFLRYVPEGMNMVAAAGLTPDIDWDAAAALVSLVADRSTAGYIALATPYLKGIDGTVAVAASVDPEAESMADARIFAMAHMDRSKISDLRKQASMLAQMAGAKVEDISESMTAIALPAEAGMPSQLYIGEIDGYLAIATYPLDGKAENSFAPVVSGHEAAAAVSFPAGAFQAERPDATYGIDIKFTLDGSEAHTRISFPGSDKSPLSILSTLWRH